MEQSRNKIAGVWTAIVTPFLKGEVDFVSLEKLIAYQMEKGIEGFVVSGTTGESPTLSTEEKKKVLQFVISKVAGQVPVMFGSGSNSTSDTIALSKAAVSWGAKSLLVVVPYYNKPPQKGLVAHFSAVAKSVDVPVVLYNVPGRTITSLSLDSIANLSQIENIVGIKEATGDIEFGKNILRECKGLQVLSGDDGTCVDLALQGAHGVISVLSHIIPDSLVSFIDRARRNDKEVSREFKKFLPVTDLLFKEANPIPVKFALKEMGIIASDEVRLPLVTASESLSKELKSELKRLGICS